jgi:hypothetical protein
MIVSKETPTSVKLGCKPLYPQVPYSEIQTPQIKKEEKKKNSESGLVVQALILARGRGRRIMSLRPVWAFRETLSQKTKQNQKSSKHR